MRLKQFYYCNGCEKVGFSITLREMGVRELWDLTLADHKAMSPSCPKEPLVISLAHILTIGADLGVLPHWAADLIGWQLITVEEESGWEYLTASASVDGYMLDVNENKKEEKRTILLHEFLNSAGKDGWDLAFFTRHRGDHQSKLILKRRKQST